MRLAARGHQACVYNRPHYNPSAPSVHRGVEVVTLPSVATKHLDAISHVAVCTAHALWRHVDIVHYHAVGPALLSWVPSLRGVCAVATVHGRDWQRPKWGGAASLALRTGEWMSMHAPDETIVVSRALVRRAIGQIRALSPLHPKRDHAGRRRRREHPGRARPRARRLRSVCLSSRAREGRPLSGRGVAAAGQRHDSRDGGRLELQHRLRAVPSSSVCARPCRVSRVRVRSETGDTLSQRRPLRSALRRRRPAHRASRGTGVRNACACQRHSAE